ncbi:hypothetical protein BJP34_14690 [Moorena producens PAL-8-15-08-1]|uniref:Uncharacterized protein n=1 Tax=Moorena producens PAL-8-15-08-1 TaxID=1458985 RepID=A0A1D8TSA5_9CYAN|nr:hypothetical protein BJP34_14690 [Moorena producens PAL-8-15-08-1]
MKSIILNSRKALTNLASSRKTTTSDAARSWGGSAVLGVPPETKPDYVEPLWLVGYAEKG